MIFRFKKQPLPGTPGVGNYAYMPSYGLPLQSIYGAATPVNGQLAVINRSPQPYYQQSKQVIGLEGISTGTIDINPAIDMDDYLSRLTAANM